MALPAEQAHRLLEALTPSRMRFGLERIERALEALGHPEGRFAAFHVAGTNGKGSTCAFAASVLRATGRRVGLYTSPHLERVNERIAVDGRPISDKALAGRLDQLLERAPGLLEGEEALSYFEVGTALAFLHFAEEGVDAAVVETGLGGRLDATSLCRPQVSVITRIGRDHTELLGDTLSAIASEKAGIFKPGVPAVVARQEPEALNALRAQAARVGSPLYEAGKDFDLIEEGAGWLAFRGHALRCSGLSLGLKGAFQLANAEAALGGLDAMLSDLSPEEVARGLLQARWPGRFEQMRLAKGITAVIDGAHNPDGARALASELRSLGRPVHLVFGVLADKEWPAMLEALLPLAAHAYLAAPSSPRALPPESYLDQAQRLSRARPFATPLEALEAALAAAGVGEVVVVAGSLYLVSSLRPRLLALRVSA